MDARTFNIESGEPDGADPDYATPFERAGQLYEQANKSILKLGDSGQLDSVEATRFQFQAAQFEMLSACFEVLERIERNTQAGDSSAVESLLEYMTGARSDQQPE